MVLTYTLYVLGYFLIGGLISSLMYTREELDESPKPLLSIFLWPFALIILPIVFFFMFKYIGSLIKKLPWDSIENKIKKVKL